MNLVRFACAHKWKRTIKCGGTVTAEIHAIASTLRTYCLRWTFARGFRDVYGYLARYIRRAGDDMNVDE